MTALKLGVAGRAGCAFTSKALDAAELQPDKVDTIVYDPAGAVTVDPEITTPADGLAVYVCVAL